MCGLPIIYRNSGCLPEYCSGYGVEFNSVSNFENSLNLMFEKYHTLKDTMPDFPNNSIKTNKEYIKLFEELYDNRFTITRDRKLNRDKVKYQFIRWMF